MTADAEEVSSIEERPPVTPRVDDWFLLLAEAPRPMLYVPPGGALTLLLNVFNAFVLLLISCFGLFFQY